MPSSTVRVVAIFRAAAGSEQTLGTVLAGLVEPTLVEAGCITYELLRSVDDEALFYFVEEWDDDATLDAHLASDHVQAAISRLDGLCADEPQIVRCRVV
jgi:quinol monooxygenase YgiN